MIPILMFSIQNLILIYGFFEILAFQAVAYEISKEATGGMAFEPAGIHMYIGVVHKLY